MKNQALIIRLAWIVALFFILLAFSCEKDEVFVEEMDTAIALEEANTVATDRSMMLVPFEGDFYGTSIKNSAIGTCVPEVPGMSPMFLPTEFNLKGEVNLMKFINGKRSSLTATNCRLGEGSINYDLELVITSESGDILVLSTNTTSFFVEPEKPEVITPASRANNAFVTARSKGHWTVMTDQCTGRFATVKGSGKNFGYIKVNVLTGEVSYTAQFKGTVTPPRPVNNLVSNPDF